MCCLRKGRREPLPEIAQGHALRLKETLDPAHSEVPSGISKLSRGNEDRQCNACWSYEFVVEDSGVLISDHLILGYYSILTQVYLVEGMSA